MDPELIEKFIEVTGESEATARQYLSLTDGNVESAITLMFEGGQAPEPESIDPEPEVRPPILPTQEILVPSDAACSFPRMSNNVFDRFRDFAVETQRQEEEMTERVSGTKQTSQRKSNRLEDLFRPPYSILFLGSFLEAREHAKTLNRWLLVNIQNPQEFACQILNRDVWSNQQIQEIIKDHFVLWQVLSNSSDGQRYIDFYNVSKYPYLAVIDPRTGECMQTYNHITVDILMFTLNDMLSTHPSPECVTSDSFSSKKWNNYPATTVTNDNSVSNSKDYDSNTRSSKHLIDSLNESDSYNGIADIQSSSSTVHTNASQNTNKKKRIDEPNLKEQIPNISKDELCEPKCDLNKIKTGSESVRLCLRLPNGKKESISMCPANTVEDFINKMESLGYSSSDHTYLVPFPKTNIGELSLKLHLSDTILSPSNTVFITKL
ncbi:PREDICTED: UBX domain-containing protein 7 [Dufourea novaeangliae]|uniref:UBX domain-containing protein 7 n=1 Tax=Dufourea novaeangliae TaxID=178035 RepID=A0A154PLA4_DUFNO|nr:PREDICTED: UBX domain-containing protein 7 [Dufourea novaeangliae]XP_015435026.1 PREDICTED: UBX domain-containing protein 7 [Dufourea novaeangliae]KZC12613.1 UBX domain-containing protein 7 [Dufourea novaeangliae]